MTDYYLAIDIGGTRLRTALFPAGSREPVRHERISTRGAGSTLDRLCDLVSRVWPDDGPVRAIGAAAPGPINPRTGVIYAAPNIPGWRNMPLKKELEDHFHVPVELGNDANLAALGEWRFGAGMGCHNLLYLTISTGIGGGVILDDRLVLGEHGLAGELGHITVLPDGPLCGCGQRGHLEAIASGTAIARWAAEQLAAGRQSSLTPDPAPTAKDVSRAAQAGDTLSIEALSRAGHFLGVALADFLHAFNPAMIVLGGGVISSGELFLAPVRQAIYDHVMSPAYVQDLKIVKASLGDDVGLFGALALAASKY